MMSKRLGIVVLVALGLTLGCLWALGGDQARAAPSPLAELHVCPSGCPYSSIQAAVDAANYGDVIKVAKGTYTGVHARAGITQVVYISTALTLRGGYTTSDWTTSDPETHPTTIDAQGKGRAICISTAPHVKITIEGFRITGGDAKGLGGNPWGDDAGGGLYINGAQPTISRNWIYGNVGEAGGGLFANNQLTLTDSILISNTADSGGGLSMADFQFANLDGNLIVSNTARFGDGGGIVFNNGDALLTNNVVADNQLRNAPRRGAGLYIYSTNVRMLHTTLARNGGGDGSALYIDDTGMPSAQSAVALTNTIITSHTVGIAVTERNTATLNATLWYANGTDRSGTGTIDHLNDHSGDPAFASDGYHLMLGSAAIDQGVNAGVTTDLDGQTRPNGGYDLGADEFTFMTPTTVTLNGPTQAMVGTPTTFTATVAPPTTTTPLTYTWQASGHTPVVRATGLRDTHPFTWTTWGTKSLTVTVENAGSTTAVSDTLTIEIAPYRIYLPLILR